MYTGLIKFLDSEDQLAGVMGHEIAHADLRHSTRQITKAMGLTLVAEILVAARAHDPAAFEEPWQRFTTDLLKMLPLDSQL